MNIITATNELKKAVSLRAAGNLLAAARSFVNSQRLASACRSAKKEQIIWEGHIGAMAAAKRILETSEDHSQRSEAGRIKVESANIFRNQ